MGMFKGGVSDSNTSFHDDHLVDVPTKEIIEQISIDLHLYIK